MFTALLTFIFIALESRSKSFFLSSLIFGVANNRNYVAFMGFGGGISGHVRLVRTNSSTSSISPYYIEFDFWGEELANINSFLLKIDGGNAITLRGHVISKGRMGNGYKEIVHFPVSDAILNQLSNCGSVTTQMIFDNPQRVPSVMVRESRALQKTIDELKEFLANRNP